MTHLTADPVIHLLKDQPQISALKVAYSGGMDSHVLLHLLAHCPQLRQQYRLEAIHINHHLHNEAQHWAEHCRQVCQHLDLQLTLIDVAIDHQKGDSLEAAARMSRYDALAQCIGLADCLLVAHHGDDQVETLLLQLCRGSGPKGLAAMAKLKIFSDGLICRPLLDYSRQQLAQYAKKYQLSWVEDSSNIDVRYDRNYLRHEVIPQLKSRWPSLNKTISRSARLCYDASTIVEQWAEQQLQALLSADGVCLMADKLKTKSMRQQKILLRQWLYSRGITIPSENKMMQILQTVVTSRHDANPIVLWSGGQIRRYQHMLYADKPLPLHYPQTILPWDLTQILILPASIGQLSAVRQSGGMIFPEAKAITVRFRQGGESCSPIGRGRHRLKKLFQEWQVPPWLRDKVPLIYCGEDIACVVGYCICSPFDNKTNALGWQIALV